MKKYYSLVIALLLVFDCAMAQNIFPPIGRAGINTLAPAATLQVKGGIRAGSLVNYTKIDSITGNLSFAGTALYNVADNNYVFKASSSNAGLFFNAAKLQYEFRSTTGNAVFNIKADNTGYLGIGNTSPNAPLQFGNILANRKIVMWEDSNNNNQFYGFGVSNSILRYQAANTSADHVFYAASSSTASNELVRIKGNGNVGIGTPNPSAKLDIAGKIKITDGTQASGKILTSDANGLATWQIPASLNETDPEVGVNTLNYLSKWNGTALVASAIFNNGTNVGIGITSPNAPLQFGNMFANRKIVMWEDANNDNQFYGFGINNNILRYQVANTSADHIFYAGSSSTASNELMRIKGNGNIGIGNPNPTVKLDITGKIRITDGTQAAGKILTSDASGLATWQTPAVLNETDPEVGVNILNYLSKWNGTSLVASGIFNNGSNVGIGTTSPNAPLQFGNILASRKIVMWEDVNNDNQFYGLGINNSALRYQVANTSADHVFYAGSSSTVSNELMRIKGNGSVFIGINTANAKAKLSVTGGQDYGIYVSNPSAAQFALYVDGSAAKPGSSAWVVASDERLKNNVQRYTDGLAQIMKIKPVKFHYNAESGFDTKKEYIGVVAQQLQAIAPYMVGKFSRITDKKEFLDVDNSAMTYMLINAVQELSAINENKEAKIELQDKKIEEQQKTNEAQQQQIDELRALVLSIQQNVQQSSPSINNANTQIKTGNALIANGVLLEQNIPNPFTNTTSISYSLPGNYGRAQIIITDKTGKKLLAKDISGNGKGRLIIDASLLASGAYSYSLYIDNKLVDTKQMILQK